MIMKKQYINPELEVVVIQTSGFMMASQDAPVGGGSQNNGNALAPGFDWDDDDWEDE